MVKERAALQILKAADLPAAAYWLEEWRYSTFARSRPGPEPTSEAYRTFIKVGLDLEGQKAPELEKVEATYSEEVKKANQVYAAEIAEVERLYALRTK